MTKDLTVTANSVREMFGKKGVRDQLIAALPKQTALTPDRLIRVALTVIRTNPDLLDCSLQSLLACLMGCAQLGLMPEPYLGQAYLVPFRNRKTGQREAQLIPGYRGYITLARNSGELDNLSADVVFQNDEFKVVKGLHEDLVHIPNYKGEQGEMVGAYTVFRYMHGSATFDFMTKTKIDKIRKRSKASDTGPWVTDYEEMAKKTVIRRHMKLAPLSIENNTLAQAAQAENLFLEGQSQKDFFLPPTDDSPVEISGGTSEEPSIEEKAKEFDETVWQGTTEIRTKFLALTAKASGISVSEVKAKALDNIESFLNVFETWKSKQKPEQKAQEQEKKPGQAETDNDAKRNFRKEWWRMQKGDRKKTGYHVYVVGNTDKIKYFCAGNKTLLRQMVDKYANVYGENWPLDAEFNVTGSMGEAEKVETEGSQDGSESISMTELMQTDEWQEMAMLQDKYPDVYKTIMQGRSAPKSVQDVMEIISIIDGRVKDFNGDIPM